MGNTFDIYRANCDGSNIELIATDVANAYYVDYSWDTLPIGRYKYGISTDGGNTISWSECLDKDVMVVDENNAMEIKVYPNPTETMITVEAENMSEIVISNMMGQTVGRYSDINASSANIDMNGYEKGTYLVRIITDNSVIVRNVVKM